MSPRLPVADRVRVELSDPRDPLGLIRDAINLTYHKANNAGDEKLRAASLTMLAHLAKVRRAAKIPEFKTPPRRVNA